MVLNTVGLRRAFKGSPRLAWTADQVGFGMRRGPSSSFLRVTLFGGSLLLAGRWQWAAEQTPHELNAEEGKKLKELKKRIDSLQKEGKFAQALEAAREVALIYEEARGPRHQDTTDAKLELETLGLLSAMPGESQENATEALRLREEGWKCYERRKFSEAEPLLRKSLEINRRVFGEEHLWTATSHIYLAWCLRAQGKHAEAVPYLRRNLEIRRRLEGEEHPFTAVAYFNLGHNLLQQGKRAEAERHLRKALDIYLRTVGEQHPDTVLTLCNLGGSLSSQGKCVEADLILRKSLDLTRRVFGEESRQAVMSYKSLGWNLFSQGKYAEAEPLLRRSLEICRRVAGEEHPDTALSYSDLGWNLFSQGRYSDSEEFLRRGLEVSIKALGEEHVETARRRGSLGLCLSRQARRAEAEALLRRSLEILLRKAGQDHQHTAEGYINLACSLGDQRKHPEAEPLLRNALEILRRVAGEESPFTAGACCLLGSNLGEQGNHTEAGALLRTGLEGFRRFLGEEHEDTVEARHSLGRILHAQGRYPEAAEECRLAFQSSEIARLRSSFTGLGRALYSARSSGSPFHSLAACLARMGKPAVAWEMLEAGMARGLLDDLAARRRRALDEAERRREESFIQLSGQTEERLSALFGLQDQGDESRSMVQELCRQRDAINAEFTQFEAELNVKYGVTVGQVCKVSTIQGTMPGDAAILAWVDLQSLPKSADPNGDHWLFVLLPRGDPVLLRLLGTGERGAWTPEDEELPDRLRAALSGPPVAGRAAEEVGRLARMLYEQRLAPAERQLAAGSGGHPVQRLIVIPAGKMAEIPMEVLTERYTISYAASGTMFARLQQESAVPHGSGFPPTLLALGDPVFERSKAPKMEAFHEREKAEALAFEARGKIAPLPATRREVQAIVRYVPGATVLLGSDSCEQNLTELATKDQLHGFRYLHLATHALMDDEQPMRSALILSQDRLPDPLQAVIARESFCDGRLTAEQIVREWKLDADLVTLSACQTALGRKAGGEGYLGFAQALFLSGARGIVVSLWKVDDTATSLLMSRFYHNLLERKLSKAAALQEAKRWLRSLPQDQARRLSADLSLVARERGAVDESEALPVPANVPYSHPFYWAAFILIGDPS